ncbi:hypothetical protein C7B69_10470 [filamentous cyanobacterium Phorm 46]|nr:hypothetical protein C7B69_10470 [filamentous cyanobacterium Phorm 46]PSB51124.1 hypothetical protein C7B67_12050 [filamentous cyanobacterium Phorm 6]
MKTAAYSTKQADNFQIVWECIQFKLACFHQVFDAAYPSGGNVTDGEARIRADGDVGIKDHPAADKYVVADVYLSYRI